MNAIKVQTIVYYAVGIAIAVLLFLILKPFILPLFWAAVLALILNPINQWLKKKTKSRNISSALTLTLATIIIVIPITILFGAAVNSVDAVYRSFSDMLFRFEAEIARVKTGYTLPFLSQGEGTLMASITERLQNSVAEILDYLARILSGIGSNILLFTVKLFVMLYALYFFMRDGEEIITKARDLVPTGSKMDTILFQNFEKAATAVLKATVILGSLQGLVGGTLFFLAGLSGALIWGFLMAFASLVPSLGCAIIWLPAGVIMLVMGDIWAGTVIILGGVLVITPIDYFLRPVIIGRDIGVHPLLIFLSSLGGIMLIGFSGLILGPVVAALATSVLETLIDRESA